MQVRDLSLKAMSKEVPNPGPRSRPYVERWHSSRKGREVKHGAHLWNFWKNVTALDIFRNFKDGPIILGHTQDAPSRKCLTRSTLTQHCLREHWQKYCQLREEFEYQRRYPICLNSTEQAHRNQEAKTSPPAMSFPEPYTNKTSVSSGKESKC